MRDIERVIPREKEKEIERRQTVAERGQWGGGGAK